MRFAVYVNCVSPHQLPLAREIAACVGEAEFRYVCQKRMLADRKSMGWSDESDPWIVEAVRAQEWLERCAVLLSGIRDVALFDRRAKRGLKTFYQSERWFKPVYLGPLALPGWLRVLLPRYFKMARAFARWLSADPHARCLAIGPWADRDFRLLCRMFCCNHSGKLIPWGYFVAPSGFTAVPHPRHRHSSSPLKILYVGRLLKLKRVDTIVKAIRRVPNATLTVVGDGPERGCLERLAEGAPVAFLGAQPIGAIRGIMRRHDVLVFASNARDGWGAVVSEALEEGIKVVGTFETGACATLLPPGNLFHAGDYKTLGKILSGRIADVDFKAWTAKSAAGKIMRLAQ